MVTPDLKNFSSIFKVRSSLSRGGTASAIGDLFPGAISYENEGKEKLAILFMVFLTTLMIHVQFLDITMPFDL